MTLATLYDDEPMAKKRPVPRPPRTPRHVLPLPGGFAAVFELQFGRGGQRVKPIFVGTYDTVQEAEKKSRP